MTPTVIIGAVVAAGAPSPLIAGAALLLLVVWSLIYCWMLKYRLRAWVTLADATILGCLALATVQIVPVSWLSTGKSWLLPFLAFACVGYQYYAGWLLGGTAAAGVLAAMIVGTSRAVPSGGSFDSVHTAIWSIVLVLLARIFWVLVHRGGRRADAALADAAQARREQILAQGIRADVLAHHRRLHDTAASTLLMVGLGQARDRRLLSAQARRDVRTLSERREAESPSVDLVQALAESIRHVPLDVHYTHPVQMHVLGSVSDAISSATREALVNVVRHASVRSCILRVSGESNHVEVDVIDVGDGFDQEQPTVGRGVRESIRGRMAACGGSATVTTAVGRGTTVRLEWPR